MEPVTATYLPGDTIQLRLEIEHEVSLVDVWANFEWRPEPEGAPPLVLAVFLRNLRLLEWNGTTRISEAVLEREVVGDISHPGVYDLVSILGLPYEKVREEKNILAFDVPPSISIRIAEPRTTTAPKVKNLELRMEPPSGPPSSRRRGGQ